MSKYFNRWITRFGLNNRIFWSAWIKTYLSTKTELSNQIILRTFSIREYIGSPSVIRKYTKPIIKAVQCKISGTIYIVKIWPHSVSLLVWVGIVVANKLVFTFGLDVDWTEGVDVTYLEETKFDRKGEKSRFYFRIFCNIKFSLTNDYFVDIIK